MKITNVKVLNVDNFKNLTEVDLSNYNVFIGKNGCGKSNLAKAIYRVAEYSLNRGYSEAAPFRGNYASPSSTFLTLLIENDELQQFKETQEYANLVRHPDAAQRSALSVLDKGEIVLRKEIGSDRRIFDFPEIDRRLSNDAQRTAVNNSIFVPLSVELRKKVIFIPDTRDLPTSFSFITNFNNEPINISNFMTFLTALKLDRRERAKYDLIMDLSKRLVPSIEDLVINPAGNYVSLGEEGSNFEIPAQEISKGTREILVLLTILVLAKERSVVFIEEPEIHLHTAAVIELRKIIREQITNKNLQVVITTHNARFLDLVSPEDPSSKVFKFVREEDGSTSVQPVSDMSELTDAMDELERKG